MTQVTRAEILKLVRQEVRTSAFERLTVDSIYEQVNKTQKSASATAKQVAGPAATATTTTPEVKVGSPPPGPVVLFQPNGFYFSVTLDFALAHQGIRTTADPPLTDEERADWGRGFGNPLVNPKKACLYVVRATISQLRVDPLIGGFKLTWTAPAGWARADRMGPTIYVEASSNPLIVQRKYLSPSTTITNATFRCQVAAWYP